MTVQPLIPLADHYNTTFMIVIALAAIFIMPFFMVNIIMMLVAI